MTAKQRRGHYRDEAFKAAAKLSQDMDRRLHELRGEILSGGVRPPLRERTLCDCL